MLSHYFGAEIPKIRFEIYSDSLDKPLYESHIYSIGKKEEYTRKSWRVWSEPKAMDTKEKSIFVEYL